MILRTGQLTDPTAATPGMRWASIAAGALLLAIAPRQENVWLPRVTGATLLGLGLYWFFRPDVAPAETHP